MTPSRVLFVECALGGASLGLADLSHEPKWMHIEKHIARRGSGEALVPMWQRIEEVVAADGKSIDGICINTGPGSFTGIKIGLAFAMGLGFGFPKPVRWLGQNGLAAWAEGHRDVEADDWVVLPITKKQLFLHHKGVSQSLALADFIQTQPKRVYLLNESPEVTEQLKDADVEVQQVPDYHEDVLNGLLAGCSRGQWSDNPPEAKYFRLSTPEEKALNDKNKDALNG